jgi:hypothetical protein
LRRFTKSSTFIVHGPQLVTMARRYDDVYERDVRDRRSRDPRDMRREPEFRERFEPREQSRPYSRESDYLEYSRDSRSDLQTVRDPPSRSAYAYPDKMQRDDVPSRSYPDDRRERHRSPIDLQPQRREEVSLYKEYFLPAEDINREVIQHDICRYLGNEATVRPYQHSDGRQGYLIRAYRALTTVGAHCPKPRPCIFCLTMANLGNDLNTEI